MYTIESGKVEKWKTIQSGKFQFPKMKKKQQEGLMLKHQLKCVS